MNGFTGCRVVLISIRQGQEEPATVPEEEKEKDYSVLARVGFGFLGIGAGIASLALYADDVSGVGLADDSVATSFAAAAIAFFIKAFTGKGKESTCGIS